MKLTINHETNYSEYDKVQLVQFYPNVSMFLFNNYTSEKYARDMKDRFSIGMWKLKQINNN